jgi:hypothetical protein
LDVADRYDSILEHGRAVLMATKFLGTIALNQWATFKLAMRFQAAANQHKNWQACSGRAA